MTRKEIRGCIDYRVEAISKKTGINLAVDYCPPYGYSLYVAKASGGQSSAGCCFIKPSTRMTAVEMLAYLDGIYNFVIDLQCGHVSINGDK